jgi:hypothetical protein
MVESSDSACSDAYANLRSHSAEVVQARFEHWVAQPAGLAVACFRARRALVS